MATFKEKTKLLSGLLTGDTAKAGPFYVDIDLTNRCNLNCLGCPYHSSLENPLMLRNQTHNDIPLELFTEICRELKTTNTHSLILQGAGEPMLHPDLFEIISTAKSAGFHVTILTNGTLLGRETIQALIDSRLDVVRVSLWASSPEQFKINHPGVNPENFRKILDGLKLFSTLKAEQKSRFPSVILYYVINPHNIHTIETIEDLATKAECDGLSFTPMHDNWGTLPSLMLSVEEQQKIKLSLSRMKKRLNNFPMTHNIDQVLFRLRTGEEVWQTLPCYIAWYHVRIRVDGTVQPCGRCDSSISFGNLNKSALKKIWNGPAIRKFRRQTLSRNGLASLGKSFDCTFCCYINDNMRVRRLFKWFSPFVSSKK